MPSKKSNSGTEPQGISLQAEPREMSAGHTVREEKIRTRAYEIYLERGGEPGRAPGNWLQAEHELEHFLVSGAQAGQEVSTRSVDRETR
jgi:Protein of unknown function (DUF2934)